MTAVTAGPGLAGGTIKTSGTLSVQFGGSGSAPSVARSDHHHQGVYQPRISQGCESGAYIARVNADGTVVCDRPNANLSTLYKLDPITGRLCLRDGRGGFVIENGTGVFNRCSDIDFGSYATNGLSVAVEGGRLGVILDLGSTEELSERYGYSETVGGGQGYASLKLDSSRTKLLIGMPWSGVKDVLETTQLFAPGQPVASALVRADHVYVMRLTDSFDPSFELIAKLYVVAYTPGESVTLRWYVL